MTEVLRSKITEEKKKKDNRQASVSIKPQASEKGTKTARNRNSKNNNNLNSVEITAKFKSTEKKVSQEKSNIDLILKRFTEGVVNTINHSKIKKEKFDLATQTTIKENNYEMEFKSANNAVIQRILTNCSVNNILVKNCGFNKLELTKDSIKLSSDIVNEGGRNSKKIILTVIRGYIVKAEEMISKIMKDVKDFEMKVKK